MEKLSWKRKAFKALSYGKGPSTAGRNFSGIITLFHRGGGAKRLLRRIDFERKNLARGVVERIEYDPNRTARIALVRWSNIQSSSWKPKHDSNETFSPERRLRFQVRRIFSYSRIEPILRHIFYLQQSQDGSFVASNPCKQAYASNKNLNVRVSHDFVKSRKYIPVKRGPSGAHETWTKRQNSTSTNSLPAPTNSVQTAFSYILAYHDLKPGDELFNINNVAVCKQRARDLFATKPSEHIGAFDELGVKSDFQSNFSEIYPVQHLYEKSGISLPLSLVPLGSQIHNIELYPGEGGKLVRAAGACAQLVQKPLKAAYASKASWSTFHGKHAHAFDTYVPLESQKASTEEVRLRLRQTSRKTTSTAYAGATEERRTHERTTKIGFQQLPPTKEKSTHDQSAAKQPNDFADIHTKDPYTCTIRLPSGQQQLLDLRCKATIGIVSNIDHNRRNFKKAGQRRWLGFRPVVRGVAMNPIDHPHGGGEGRTKGGRPSVSPWGKPAKGHNSNPLAKRRSTARKAR
jgi:ribosomal protein L2